MDCETYVDPQPVVTLYTDGKGRWLKRVWGFQCPTPIHELLWSRHSDCLEGLGGGTPRTWKSAINSPQRSTL
jgi:hypothetical protein